MQKRVWLSHFFFVPDHSMHFKKLWKILWVNRIIFITGTEKPYNFVLHIMYYDVKVHKVEILLAF